MKNKNEAKFVGILVGVILLAGCNTQNHRFVKLDPAESGISFENTLTERKDFNIIDYLYFYDGGGVAIGDINEDGLPDLFFSGNQVKNKLYLNKGGLKFEDITEKAGVAGNSSWNTGSVMGDVNGDGLLDIYVCAVVGLKGLIGHNELFINNGDNTFSEQSAAYGLDFDSYSCSAAFLDYDKDGDLDIYLLNHAVHTPESFGNANLRNQRTYETGDKLLRNDGGKFVDVSEAAHIYGGVNGYGLGIAVSDFNSDGYPDLYIGNDFHEDDYYYVNNRDGTFTEQLRKSFTQTSRFSMGNDVADINHDGYPDLVTLDMLPDTEEVLKRTEGDEDINILKLRTDEYGYYYQFERNMMQINQGNGEFAETALMSGVAATDWSWGSLFADFDQDGNQDLFISNGIPRRPNDLDYIKFVSSEQIVGTIEETRLVDDQALELMPSGKIKNFIFKGSGSYGFQDVSEDWLPDEKTCSTSLAMGDLDNDGDIDIVVNNTDGQPGIYINQTNETANYLKIKLKYKKENAFGVGTRIYAYQNGVLQYKEMYTARGFQASSEPLIHFGCGKSAEIDSIKIIWPDNRIQKLSHVKTNQTLVISPGEGLDTLKFNNNIKTKMTFKQVEDVLGIKFQHREDDYTDFDRMKLLPYQQSDRGPATAIGDINNDGKLDIYFGGSKRIPGQFFIQQDTGFVARYFPSIQKDSIKEDVAAVIEDFNNDGKTDLFIGTGGADFYGKSRPLLDSYYMSNDSSFLQVEIQGYFENASCVKVSDFDKDGDKDVFVGNESVSNDFGNEPKSYLLQNDNGKLEPVQKELFESLGMVTDAVWDDYNNDGQTDLIIIGEWMEPVFLKNEKGTFKREELLSEKLNGLWQCIIPFDIDHDGDNDYLLGNWGLNSKFRASDEFPMKMYYSDFDNNGKSEAIVATEKNGNYFPINSFDMVASQIVSLRKKFTDYNSFAGKSMQEIFTEEQLEKAKIYNVQQLASGFLKNEKSGFNFAPFSEALQLAPIMAMEKYDFDGDGKEEVLVGGNYFGVQPFQGRYGSFGGALIKDTIQIASGKAIGLDLLNKSVRHFNIFSFKNEDYLLVTVNNDKAQIYKLQK